MKEASIKSTLKDLLELTKPRLTALVAFTTLFGLIMAPAETSVLKAFFSVGLISMLVGGACALNCYMEREIDKTMDRTKNRALPSGRMNPELALLFAMMLIMGSVFCLYKYINPITALLGVVAAVLYIYAYTPLKRKSTLALYAGAIPGALPPVLGWTAVTGQIDAMAWALFLIIFVWQIPHFLAISLFNQEDYEKASIKIIPTLKGVRKTKIGIIFYSALLLIVSLLPMVFGIESKIYAVISLVLGGAMIGIALRGLSISDTLVKSWARSYFYATLVYLPIIFLSLSVA